MSNLGNGLRLFAVEWHVDYWDYLGYPDPYSSEIYTQRQSDYLGPQLFTPHVLVQGQTQQPVSSSGVDAGVAAALTVGVPSSVTMWQDTEADDLVIHYKTLDAPADAMLHLVMVERGISNDIPAGENAGKTLHHEAAARWYAVVPPDRGAILVDYPADVVLANARFIGFIQSPLTMALHGATTVETLLP